ncbi:MAG TPA: hypothetical protein VGH60_01035 [Solirubrobacteraceae bacterium]|jgi:hypothetical protein
MPQSAIRIAPRWGSASPHAGQEITRALDEGYAVVLVSADGRERVITAKMLAGG